MTARRRRRRSGDPAAVVLAVGAIVLVVIVVTHLGWLILGAGAAVAGVALGRRSRQSVAGRAQFARQLSDAQADRDRHAARADRAIAERDQLEARAVDLAGQLERQAAEHSAERARLTGAMHAAWDAAASRPPKRDTPDGREPDNDPAVAAMLADPLSGVRRLGRQ